MGLRLAVPWRGNTVVAVDPPGPIKPLYQRLV